MNIKQHDSVGLRRFAKARNVLASVTILLAIGGGMARGQAPAGLDALSEERLMAELAGRGLNDLLDRAFVINNVTPEQREGILTLSAMRELTNPATKLTPKQRQQAIRRVVTGIEKALPNLHDPRQLMQQASVLITEAAMRDVNTLEFWGETPRTQANLRPVMETVEKILDKCALEATAAAERIAKGITTTLTPQQQAEWTAMDALANSAKYTKTMAGYYTCLSLDPANPKRKEIADKSLEELKQYDNAESQVQAIIRNRMAKLLMTKGLYAEAKKMFSSVLGDPVIQPPPEVDQKYEAYYFSAVCDLMSKDLAGAGKALETLKAWQKDNLPKDKPSQDGADAAADMLQYRIYSAQAMAETTPAAKQATDAKATQTLLELQKKQPSLGNIIAAQLLARLPDDADVTGLDPLLLQAVIQRGDQERLKAEGETVDKKAMERAVLAAREMLKRKGQPNVTADLLDSSTLLIPLFLDRLGRSLEAVQGFTDYAENPGGSAENRSAALDNALAMVGELRKADPSDPGAAQAYERLLPIAINRPFLRKALAFEYARRLQLLGKNKDAITYFRQVPPDDKRLLFARFYETLALQQEMDANGSKMEKAEKDQLIAELLKRAEEVDRTAKTAMTSAATDQDRRNFKSILIKTALLRAEVTKNIDPKRPLEILAGFEETVQGMPGQDDLLASALFLRVNSYMELGQNTEATKALLSLLNTKSGSDGAGIVYTLLKKLDDDYEKARQDNNLAQMRKLASARAQLSGHMVTWAKNNPDPNIKKFTYRYMVFDAETKRVAASLEQDPIIRKSGLSTALRLYQALLDSEGNAMYLATIDPKKVDPKYPDPVVMLNVALIQFDLENWAAAQEGLGKLLNDRKLATAKIVVKKGEDEVLVDNDAYWEAMFKWMTATVKLNDSATVEDMKTTLKRQYVQWGEDVGGKKWRDKFTELRQKVIPDFKLEGEGAAATTTTTK